MDGWGEGVTFAYMRSALAEYRENLVTQCVYMHANAPHHMTSGTVPFKEGTVPCLQPQGEFLMKQEGIMSSP